MKKSLIISIITIIFCFSPSTQAKGTTIPKSNGNVESHSTAQNEAFPFTVNNVGKKVIFSPGNLYWNGRNFTFEAHQYNSPTTWDPNHIGHFYWSKNASVAYALTYKDKALSSDKFFASNGGAIAKWTVLSKEEWSYLFSHALVKKTPNNTITIAGKKCIVLKPDGFKGTVSNSYSAQQWAEAEIKYGLVALPIAGLRNGTYLTGSGSSGHYWSSTLDPSSSDYAYYALFVSSDNDVSMDCFYREDGYSVRLVSVIQ